MANKQIETIFGEVMEAIDKGQENGNQRITNNIKSLDFRKVLFSAGEVYTGEIGKAICNVFKKYTEEGK
jgi:hypothetical protein